MVDRLTEVSKRLGLTNAKVALAWILQKPGVTSPIIGATRMSQLDDAIEALSIKLAPEDVRALEEIYQPHPIIGH